MKFLPFNIILDLGIKPAVPKTVIFDDIELPENWDEFIKKIIKNPYDNNPKPYITPPDPFPWKIEPNPWIVQPQPWRIEPYQPWNVQPQPWNTQPYIGDDPYKFPLTNVWYTTTTNTNSISTSSGVSTSSNVSTDQSITYSPTELKSNNLRDWLQIYNNTGQLLQHVK